MRGYVIQADGQAGLFCYSLFETQNKKRVKRSAYIENPQSVLHSPDLIQYQKYRGFPDAAERIGW